jgi:hypothetical protein
MLNFRLLNLSIAASEENQRDIWYYLTQGIHFFFKRLFTPDPLARKLCLLKQWPATGKEIK